MFTQIYIFFLTLVFGNLFGTILNAYSTSDSEIFVYFINETVLHFFFFYLPLLFLTYVLHTKQILNIDVFSHKKYLLYLLIIFFILAIILGVYDIAPVQLLLFGITFG